MYAETYQAVQLYNQAQSAEQTSKLDLAEVYYLKSYTLFEESGGKYYVNAARVLNTLAALRRTRGNYEGAFRSVQKSVQLIEAYPGIFTSTEAETIRMQAWELVKNLLLLQEPQGQFSPAF